MHCTLYGIPNCDQVKKARTFLTQNNIDFDFIDFKKNLVTSQLIHSWLAVEPTLTWMDFLNKRGTTWRKLPENRQAEVVDEASAIACMMEHASLIKRPILLGVKDNKTQLLIGFSEENYRHFFE